MFSVKDGIIIKINFLKSNFMVNIKHFQLKQPHMTAAEILAVDLTKVTTGISEEMRKALENADSEGRLECVWGMDITLQAQSHMTAAEILAVDPTKVTKGPSEQVKNALRRAESEGRLKCVWEINIILPK